jgi:hypothetical protein
MLKKYLIVVFYFIIIITIIVLVFHRILDFKNGAGCLSWPQFFSLQQKEKGFIFSREKLISCCIR